MGRVCITLPDRKAKRLGRHLLIEHPITRGKLKVNGNKLLKSKKRK